MGLGPVSSSLQTGERVGRDAGQRLLDLLRPQRPLPADSSQSQARRPLPRTGASVMGAGHGIAYSLERRSLFSLVRFWGSSMSQPPAGHLRCRPPHIGSSALVADARARLGSRIPGRYSRQSNDPAFRSHARRGATGRVAPHFICVHAASGRGFAYVPGTEQGNVCGACRACWNKKVDHVSYRRH